MSSGVPVLPGFSSALFQVLKTFACIVLQYEPAMPAEVSFTDMYKAGVVPDWENGTNTKIPQLQQDNEVFEEYYDDVPSWEEEDDEDFEVHCSRVCISLSIPATCCAETSLHTIFCASACH